MHVGNHWIVPSINATNKMPNQTAIASLDILSCQVITILTSIAMETKVPSRNVHPIAVTRVISHQEQESRAEGTWHNQPQVCVST